MNLQERCVCGGLIVACASWAIREAVQRHNATDQHLRWRRRRDHAEATAAWRARIRGELAERRLLRELVRENPEVAA